MLDHVFPSTIYVPLFTYFLSSTVKVRSGQTASFRVSTLGFFLLFFPFYVFFSIHSKTSHNMNLFAAPEEEKEEEEEEEGEEGKGEEEDMFYLDCVEVAGLDYEKKYATKF